MKRQNAFQIMLIISACLMLSRFTPAQNQFNANVSEKNSQAGLDEYFHNVISKYNYVALGACLIKDQKITWEGSYGFADLEENKALKTDDIFQLASLSKTVTATALMQLYERGLFQLDDDVNKYVPFSVRNPNFPDKPITIRMLLTHTNSFDDLLPMGNKISLGVGGDSPIPFKEYTEGLFTPGSKYYSVDYFSKTIEPGTKYSYSNISFSLIGYLVEVLSGKEFDVYCNENIFFPLEMSNTNWHLRGLDTSKCVFGYGIRPGDTSKTYKKQRHFGTPGYPEGMLRTTMQDFSHFISAFINEGRYKDFQMLKPETVKEMLTPQIHDVPNRTYNSMDMGLTWNILNIEGDTLYSMNGFSGSIFAVAYFSRSNKVGMIYFFTGLNIKNMQGVPDITHTLYTAIKKETQPGL